MSIQWYPGHMAKAKRQVTEKLKQIDVVFELVDARLPLSSRNPMMDDLVAQKPRLLLLNKADMADPAVTERWLAYWQKKSKAGQSPVRAIAIDSRNGKGTGRIPEESQKLVSDMLRKRAEKGMRARAIRALIVGIPNVGKSSLINRLANRHIAKTGDRPGITKAQQWIKVGKQLELLDTPGILWPKFDDEQVGYRLAASGAIRDEILHRDDIALFALRFLIKSYPKRVSERYNLDELSEDPVLLLEEIGRKRGCLAGGGMVDFERASDVLLQDLRTGKLGSISFEQPPETCRTTA
jgi:ribosome biogenesis GTPase A